MLLDLLRGTALKIFSENVYENENSEKLIISDKEDIEKVGDVGKEIGREALGNVYDDKIDVTVNILYLENLKLVIELGIYEFLFTFLPKSDPNQRHIEYRRWWIYTSIKTSFLFQCFTGRSSTTQ